MISEKFCGVIRDPLCKSKSSVAQKKTHGYIYHSDLELSDKSRD